LVSSTQPITRIPISRPFFGKEERDAIVKPLDTGWVVQGPYVKEFEDRFGRFVGSRHAAASSSCTTALHLAVAALGLQTGDEVIVPAFTWVATANAVEYMGATPRFVEIELTTFNLDMSRAQQAVTPRTRGIIPVHLFGLCSDMDKVRHLSKQSGLWIVEDAACAFGASFRGRHAGTFGDAGCFSFHPRKSITTGEGGMLTTEREDLIDRVRSLRDHGASRSDLQRHSSAGSFLLADYPMLGYNYRMTDLQGAIGCAQMDRAKGILAERDRLARRYSDLLAGIEALRLPSVPTGYVHGWQSYTTLFAPEAPSLANVDRLHGRRNRLMEQLEARGIATRQGTHAAALQEYYRTKYRIRPDHFPNAWIADRTSLSLPLYAGLSDADQDLVCGEIRRAIRA
jgi:dTDP-4-amino-4,6-dideoxygalactose transaminase